MKTAVKVIIAIALLCIPGFWLWYQNKPPSPPPQPKPKIKVEAKKHKEEKVEPRIEALIETSKGNITVVLYGKEAPITVKNFVGLVNREFYDGLIFHRVEPGFVIQTGDPLGTGSGGSDKTIPLEIAPSLKHDKAGTLGMARSNDPNSASSQFYITLSPTPNLDGNYAVFGRVLTGMDVVNKIQVNDRLMKIRLLPEKKPDAEKASDER